MNKKEKKKKKDFNPLTGYIAIILNQLLESARLLDRFPNVFEKKKKKKKKMAKK